MISKEIIKNEIDRIPDELAIKVLDYIHHLQREKHKKKRIHTYKLNGEFDHLNIRKKAYE